jgi:hypothetical protein
LTEIADLQAAAARFVPLTAPVAAGDAQELAELLARLGLEERIERVADVLSAGDPDAALASVAALVGDLEPEWPPGTSSLPALVCRAAVSARVRRPDCGQAVAELDRRLAAEPQDAELVLERLGSGLLPLAGLDVAAALHYAKVFVDNFPASSRPLGDVDERAARWLAQLLDLGGVRTALRQALLDVAAAWEPEHALAAAQLRAWAEAPVPADQTQDLPWVRSLLPLARTQV